MAKDKSTIRGKTLTDISQHISSVNEEYIIPKSNPKVRQKKLPLALETTHYIELVNQKINNIRNPPAKSYLEFQNSQLTETQHNQGSVSYSESTLNSYHDPMLSLSQGNLDFQNIPIKPITIKDASIFAPVKTELIQHDNVIENRLELSFNNDVAVVKNKSNSEDNQNSEAINHFKNGMCVWVFWEEFDSLFPVRIIN